MGCVLVSVKRFLCKTLNKVFPLPAHPFNLQSQGTMTYAQWQYEQGENTLAFFLGHVTLEEMFRGKIALDIGCGPGGKTLYFASKGPKLIYGIDVLPHYEGEANALAAEKGLQDKFRFVLGDATRLPFDDGFFDTIVMNDTMEHVAEPLKVLKECYRVLKNGGRLYVNFPPYHHPFGAHLQDVIGIPWVHLLFNEQTLIDVYRELTARLVDGEERLKFRISRDERGKEYFSYINKMTIARFKRLLNATDYEIIHYEEVPLRPYLRPLARVPALKEGFTKMVVAILGK